MDDVLAEAAADLLIGGRHLDLFAADALDRKSDARPEDLILGTT